MAFSHVHNEDDVGSWQEHNKSLVYLQTFLPISSQQFLTEIEWSYCSIDHTVILSPSQNGTLPLQMINGRWKRIEYVIQPWFLPTAALQRRFRNTIEQLTFNTSPYINIEQKDKKERNRNKNHGEQCEKTLNIRCRARKILTEIKMM